MTLVNEVISSQPIRAFFGGRGAMAVSDDVQAMIDTLTEAMGDAAKHDKGVDAAGRRLRGTLSAIGKSCKTLRGKIQDERNSR